MGLIVAPCYVMQYLVSTYRLAIIWLRKRELVALSYCCHVAVSVLCLFLTVSWVGLWSVIVAFPGPEVIKP